MAIMDKKAYASLLEKERQRRGPYFICSLSCTQFVCLFALSGIQLFVIGVSPYILISLYVLTALTVSLGGA